MLRFVLLIALPMVALCNPVSPPTNREEMRAYMEKYTKPCIVHNRDCPSGAVGWDFESFSPIVRQLRSYRLPDECKCDFTAESCNRACYYAYLLSTYKRSVTAGKTDPTEIENAVKQVVELFETRYKPCVLENRNCDQIGGMSYENIRSQVEQAVQMYGLPDECDFERETESAIRRCYYAIMLRSSLKAFPKKK